MSLALTGGHVHLRSKSYSVKLRSHRPPEITSNASSPAVNFLATCQQAYKEGHKMYYSENTFHMPPGSLEEMTLLLNNIRPECLAMMKHVELNFSLLDLTPSVLKEVEANLAKTGDKVPYDRQWQTWRLPIPKNAIYLKLLKDSLRCLWDGKLLVARSSFSNLEDLRIRFFAHFSGGGSNSVLILQGRNADGLIGAHPAMGKDTFDARSDLDLMDSYEKFTGDVAAVAQAMVTSRVLEKGWRNFKSWLSPESMFALEQEWKGFMEVRSQQWYDLGFSMEVD